MYFRDRLKWRFGRIKQLGIKHSLKILTTSELQKRLFKPLLNVVNRRKYEGELSVVLNRHSGSKVFVFPPNIEWNLPLTQRWQHLASHLSGLGVLYFFCSPNILRDNISGLKEVSSGCYLTDQFKFLLSLKREKVFHLTCFDFNFSYAHLRQEIEKGNSIIYEYYDVYDDKLIGFVPEGLRKRHYRVLSDPRIICIASSQRLYDEVSHYRNTNYALITNGVDVAHFCNVGSRKPIPNELKGFVGSDKKVVGYFGAIASWLDYDLVINLATIRPEYNILLIGYKHDKSFERISSLSLPNIRMIGPIDYSVLPEYACWFDIAIIPFVTNEITLAVSPIKLFEYMALGKPIVTTNQPEFTKYKSVLVAENNADFIDKIDYGLTLIKDEKYQTVIRKEADANSWEHKARQLLDMIN
jgi:teichuronic acid biosynthesis glycosyltransferase TuaH